MDQSATYCPEDNKIRLYVGRVPRDEYEKLRADGWTCTPKQDCNFVATWTPSRRDTALEYGGGFIGDEDAGPAERGADRAQRFGNYRDKRTSEANVFADNYEAGPSAHGYQSQARADRATARYDRIADRAGDVWSKAEYWTRRTSGVISHALYKSTPGVRMGRIKILEADLRKHAVEVEKRSASFKLWQTVAGVSDVEKQNKQAKFLADYEHGQYKHPITGAEMSLYRIAEDTGVTGAQVAALWLACHSEPTQEDDWSLHYRLRLAYENQMLEAQGGRAAFVEMLAGGFIGSHQILKVNKSAATGRVVSVQVMGKHTGFTKAGGYKESATLAVPVTLNIERLAAEVYRPPTAEELAAFEADKKARKAATPKKPECPLINPTDEDAERLQALWNERAKIGLDKWNLEHFEPATVCRVTQAVYSLNSKGAYGRAETRGLRRDGQRAPRESNMYNGEQAKRDREQGPAVCLIRITSSSGYHTPPCVIILTDKPQKPLVAAVWEQYTPAAVKAELVTA